MESVQATRLRKGMLVKMNNELHRVLDVKHITPGKGRAFVQSRMRNIRAGTLLDHKFRSVDFVERAEQEKARRAKMRRRQAIVERYRSNTLSIHHWVSNLLIGASPEGLESWSYVGLFTVDDDGAVLHGSVIKGVKGLAILKHHVVGHVYHVVDRTLPRLLKAPL